MTAYEIVEKKLVEGMHVGEMHTCLRDIGRLAGGYYTGKEITASDMGQLEALACRLSKTPSVALTTWREAVAFGGKTPIEHEEDFGAFTFEDNVDLTSYDRKRKLREAAPVPLVDQLWVQAEEIPEPAADWQPGDMLRYLEAMFQPDECVGVVPRAWEQPETGRWLPQKGFWDLSRSSLTDSLRRTPGSSVDAIGDYTVEAGAWVRINPLDGKGVKDENVTSFRHSLIEADDQDLGKQLALIKALKLPCTAIVHSGGKSIHALVRVDAASIEEYRTRVDKLYEICKTAGLRVDGANRNPSRLSRLPGVTRNGKPQYMIATNPDAAASWEAWEKFIEDTHDDLPDPQRLRTKFFSPPPLAEELIEGILRMGDKMRLTGPSKAGKSFGLIGLTVCLAEGFPWMGSACKQGRVLYINLELNEASCIHRFRDVYKAMGIALPDGIDNIDVWHLRGHCVPLDKLAPKLIRRAEGKGYIAVIIDPIYKIQFGDENDAGDVAKFCNQIDAICKKLGCAVIDAHHHSKGAQGQKRSIDRGSGSGVFGRDPDSILDLIELNISDARRDQMKSHIAHDALMALGALHSLDMGKIPVDARMPSAAFLIEWNNAFPALTAEATNAVVAAEKAAMALSGWRVEGTLREFAPLVPRTCWFKHPLHLTDTWDLLADAKAEGEEEPWQKNQMPPEEREAKKAEREAAKEVSDAVKAAAKELARVARVDAQNATAKKREEAKSATRSAKARAVADAAQRTIVENAAAFQTALAGAGGPGVATIAGVAEILGCTGRTVRIRVSELVGLTVERNVIVTGKAVK